MKALSGMGSSLQEGSGTLLTRHLFAFHSFGGLTSFGSGMLAKKWYGAAGEIN
jgi:hypothetical protein